MKKIFVIYSIIITSILAQIENIPYDWAGQYGAISNNGQVMWNRDWQVGPLLFDGTFSHYPLRFGKNYLNHFSIKRVGDTYESNTDFPDTTNIWSKADYYRGDYSYDQLEMILNFEEKNRIISLNGFKRTYKGPYAQYLADDESLNPLQQSYRLDYISRNDKALIDLSIGYFHTDSRLNISDPADFRHKEKTLSFGVGYQREIGSWDYKSHLAASQQYYLMRFDTTQYYRPEYDSTEAYLNRAHLSNVFVRELSENYSIDLGFEIDAQALKFKMPDNEKLDRMWSTIYGNYNYRNFQIKLGATFDNNNIHPNVRASNILNLGELGAINSKVSYFAKPSHLFYNEDKMENWLTGKILGNFSIGNILLTLSLFYSNTNANPVYRYSDENISFDMSKDLFTSSIGTLLPFIRDWEIEASYRHTFSENIYSDGIGDRINFGLNIDEELFKKKMDLNLKIWTDGYLNHSNKIGYDAFHFGPYATDNSNFVLPDYWVYNLDLSIKVSKMTFGWKVNNLLNTFDVVTEQVLPNIGDEYLYINNSYNFPPMSRFVSFNIIWEFDN